MTNPDEQDEPQVEGEQVEDGPLGQNDTREPSEEQQPNEPMSTAVPGEPQE